MKKVVNRSPLLALPKYINEGVNVSEYSLNEKRGWAKHRDVVVLYTDGGCVYKNPSPFGITWAWCGISRDGKMALYESGLIETNKTTYGLLTNNQSEQIAIIRALEAMPDGWEGLLCSDSQIALGRTFRGYKTKNLPQNMVDRTREAVDRLGEVKYMLLQGHPQLVDLENGIGAKRNRPVSIFNVFCDELCSEESRKYIENHPEVRNESSRNFQGVSVKS